MKPKTLGLSRSVHARLAQRAQSLGIKEYRTPLISVAVTGKFDLRGEEER